MNHREVALQIAIATYLKTVLPFGWRIHHSPNGAELADKGRAWAKFKAMGTLVGFPDLMIFGRQVHFSPGQCEGDELPWTGLLEVKTPAVHGPGKKPGTRKVLIRAGTLSDEQIALHADLKLMGFKVGVVDGIDATRAWCLKHGLPIREVTYEPMRASA